jgi:HTH-type transcriptional regulator/antitoxin HigA
MSNALAIASNSKRVAPRRPVWGARVPPVTIRNKSAHQAALDELMRLGRLADAGAATPQQTDAAHVLLLLIQDYETARCGEAGAIRDNPIERLRYLMEENGMSASDLGRLLGDRSLGSRILNGERELSKSHIKKLAEHFHLEPGFFL